MRANNDPWRYANELAALGIVAIITSFAVTLLAVARRAGPVPADTPAGAGRTPEATGAATPESVAIVIGVAALMGLIVFGAQIAKERRGSKRYDCRLPCHVAFAGEDFRARLVNISETGAQLKTKGYTLREGDRLSLTVANARLDATVIWTGSGRAGVKFIRKLDYDTFRGVLRRARERGFLKRENPPDDATSSTTPDAEAAEMEEAPERDAREPPVLRIDQTLNVKRPLS